MRQQLVCAQIGRLTAVEDGFGDVRGEIAEADKPREIGWAHPLPLGQELLRNVGDGRGQAASGCWLTASMPSMNFMPVISFGNWLWPSRRRQLFSAACASLKIMAIAVLFERHPLERTVRCRTVANVLSMGLVVRRCFQCSAGKS